MRISSRLLGALLLGIGGACADSPGELKPIGGDWYIEHVSVSGWEPSHSRENLRRKAGAGTVLVDEWIDEYRFYEPDCVVYGVQHVNAPRFAVCGDRTPILMPRWILEFREDGLWGGYVTSQEDGKTVQWWEMVPIESVRAVAMRQPKFRRGWASTSAASAPAPLEKVVVKIAGKP